MNQDEITAAYRTHARSRMRGKDSEAGRLAERLGRRWPAEAAEPPPSPRAPARLERHEIPRARDDEEHGADTTADAETGEHDRVVALVHREDACGNGGASRHRDQPPATPPRP
jgi:hypothetical protein